MNNIAIIPQGFDFTKDLAPVGLGSYLQMGITWEAMLAQLYALVSAVRSYCKL